MQVIGAGFGRTGTLSLKFALEELGFGPTYHMQEAMRRPSHVRRWLDYAETGKADWGALFAKFGSGVDYPVSCVWEELAAYYPDASIILTVRDPEQWWESTNSTIYGFQTALSPWFRRMVPPNGFSSSTSPTGGSRSVRSSTFRYLIDPSRTSTTRR